VPFPSDTPSASTCTGLHPAQDGLADFAARNADRVIAGVGALASQAVVEGVTKAQPGKLVAGAAGIATAGVVSVVSREQNATGAHGGGSALLDQAGLPRGVDVQTKDGVRLGVKGAWDAPAPQKGAPVTLGASNARVEWHLGADVPLHEDTTLSADARATVGLDGRVQKASAEIGVKRPDARAHGAVRVTPPRTADAPLRVDAQVDVTTAPVSVTAAADVELQRGEVQRANVSARVDTRVVSAGGDLAVKRGKDGLALEEANADVEVSPTPAFSAGLRARILPQGIDGIAASLATYGDDGSLALEARGTHLTTKPTVAVAVTATPKRAPVSVTVHAEVAPGIGETSGGIGIRGRF
jgi:hypothetical protein